MKKLLTLVFTVALALSLSAVSFAQDASSAPAAPADQKMDQKMDKKEAKAEKKAHKKEAKAEKKMKKEKKDDMKKDDSMAK